MLLSCFLKLALLYFRNSSAFNLNTSISTIQFPQAWKASWASPIFMDEDTNDRYISVLRSILSIWEKLAY